MMIALPQTIVGHASDLRWMAACCRVVMAALTLTLALASAASAQPSLLEPPQTSASGGIAAPAAPATGEVVSVETRWNNPRATPGSQRILAVIADIAPTYHINPREKDIPEDFSFLIPTTIDISDAPGAITIGEPQFPTPHQVRVEFGEKSQEILSYEGRTVFYVPITIGPDAPRGEITLKLAFGYQACDANTCLFPQTKELGATLEIVSPGTDTSSDQNEEERDIFAGFDPSGFDTPATPEPTEASDDEGAASAVTFDLFGLSFSLNPEGLIGIVSLLLVAAFGGMLLNFTPCVLPVIPLKIMSLSQSAGHRARCLALGAAMSLGVVAFWLGLGIAISALSGFTAANQLFQYPLFTILVGVIIAVMAVGMCGLFAVRLPKFVYMVNPQHDSYGGSFAFGIMTAVLSTPCTAPFMGAAAAWAATQHPTTTLATFAAIGGGMALPYLVLAAYPKLVERMPRTGPASEVLKQVMGLCMLAAAAYFIGVGVSGLTADPLTGPSRAYWWGVMGMLFAAGGWLAWRTIRITPKPSRRLVFVSLGLVLMAGSAYGGFALTKKGPTQWIYYTPERFETALEQGRIVVVDFTAEWCLNCKWLEENVLDTKAVAEALAREDVIPIKVDLTGNNQAGNAMLKRTGRLTIPLLVIYAPESPGSPGNPGKSGGPETPGGREVFKSDFYTAQQVLDAINRAGELAIGG